MSDNPQQSFVEGPLGAPMGPENQNFSISTSIAKLYIKFDPIDSAINWCASRSKIYGSRDEKQPLYEFVGAHYGPTWDPIIFFRFQQLLARYISNSLSLMIQLLGTPTKWVRGPGQPF